MSLSWRWRGSSRRRCGPGPSRFGPCRPAVRTGRPPGLTRPGRMTRTVTRRDHLRDAVLAGAATGLRSTAGLAALTHARAPGLPPPLTHRRAPALAMLGVAVELVLDKLPSTPSRLDPRGLAFRAAFAGAAGTVLKRGAGRPVPGAALVAAAAALASAKVGHDIRVAVAARVGDLAVAMAEDALALGLAAAAAR